MFLTEKITKENISEVSHLLRPFHQSKLSQGLNQSICYALYCVDTPFGLVYGEVDESRNQFVISASKKTVNFYEMNYFGRDFNFLEMS